MKFLFDYLPIMCFFIAYKLWGVYVATAVAMGVSFLQVSAYWLKNRRFEKLHLITLVLILLLGGSTLIFHNVIFIKWKPTVVYWLFSSILFGSQYIGKQPVLQRMLNDKVPLPSRTWQHLNLSWALFFAFLGALNLYILYHYDTNTWVNFKLFGTLGLTFAFVILQACYMARHMKESEENKKPINEN